jgi:hypothetical protein
MKARWLAVGVAIGFALALTVGFAYGGGSSGSMMGGFAPAGFAPEGSAPTVSSSYRSGTTWWEAMEAMHDSPQMRAMHEQMPEDLQASCDALHEQATSRPGGMMGSGSATGYGGMMGSGYGGMMGSGSGGMMGS